MRDMGVGKEGHVGKAFFWSRIDIQLIECVKWARGGRTGQGRLLVTAAAAFPPTKIGSLNQKEAWTESRKSCLTREWEL